MSTLVVAPSALPVPALIAVSGDRASVRFLEFFAATIRNPHTRRAYGRAVGDFLAWCESVGVASLAALSSSNACSSMVSMRLLFQSMVPLSHS